MFSEGKIVEFLHILSKKYYAAVKMNTDMFKSKQMPVISCEMKQKEKTKQCVKKIPPVRSEFQQELQMICKHFEFESPVVS